MAGTDSSKDGVAGGPAVVLVGPQLGENIGFAARAMANCGLSELRLVTPRDGWPNPRAVAAASGADAVLDGARLYDDLGAAIADRRRVYAATVRTRDMQMPVVTARRAAAELRAADAEGAGAAIVFGPERAGLTNDQLALADTLLTVPANPAFGSLSLAQAVMVVGYEWYQAGAQAPARTEPAAADAPATKAALLGFFEHFEAELDACGFLHPKEMRPTIVRNLRNLFQRAGLTDREVRTLRGVVSGLTRAHERRASERTTGTGEDQ